MKYFIAARAACLTLTLSIAGCSTFAYYNKPLSSAEPPARATFNIRDDRGEKDVLVMLALSGGGSRAAYFSAAVMLRLQQVFPDLDLLQEVDVISSVSGGSLPAAYYAVSRDRAARLRTEPPPAVRAHPKLRYDAAARELAIAHTLTPEETQAVRAAFADSVDLRRFERLLIQQDVASNRFWDPRTVRDLMGRNYIARWIGNWFWPDNIFNFWFTAYDRSDIMAQTFADNLYDVHFTGRDLVFRDINRERPYLILNATNATGGEPGLEFGSVFTFTDEDFRQRAGSDVGSYFIARGVMASATFPVVFNYMTLNNFLSKDKRYLHIFDGGNADNLGLTSLKRILLDERINPPGRYRKIVVILVDAYVRSKGISSRKADGRCPFCYVADMNVVDAVDSLLEANRDNALQDFKERINVSKDCRRGNLPSVICQSPRLAGQIAEVERKLFFYHVGFEDSQLRDRLQQIPTDFRMTKDEQGQLNSVYIDAAAEELITGGNECLLQARRILLGEKGSQAVTRYCTWRADQAVKTAKGDERR